MNDDTLDRILDEVAKTVVTLSLDALPLSKGCG